MKLKITASKHITLLEVRADGKDNLVVSYGKNKLSRCEGILVKRRSQAMKLYLNNDRVVDYVRVQKNPPFLH